MWRVLGCCFVLALLVLASRPGNLQADPGDPETNYYSFFRGWPSEREPSDEIPRFLEEGERLQCDRSQLIRYRSETLRYGAFVRPEFAARLRRLDAHVAQLAVTSFGRAPRRLVHRGTFNCRSARGRRGRVSEHALGNAIDVTGFDFGPLPRGAEAPEDLPRALRRAFRVRVSTHWSPRHRRHARKAQFLHQLAEDVRSRSDLFRGIVGPPRPRHGDHLHLDAAPWQYAMFGYDPPPD